MASGFQFGPARNHDGAIGQFVLFVKYKGIDYYSGDCRKPSRTLLTDDREKVFTKGEYQLCDPTPDAIEVVKNFPCFGERTLWFFPTVLYTPQNLLKMENVDGFPARKNSLCQGPKWKVGV